MQRPRLAGEEAFGVIMQIPQIQVTNLWAFDTDNAKEMPGGNFEAAGFTGRHDDL